MTATYAILGATGSTGSSILTYLLGRDDTRIKVYVRSRAKLLKAFPNLDENKKVQIFEGSIEDIEVISACVRDTKAVFSTVAINENVPHMRVAQHTAHCVVAALSTNRIAEPSSKVPTVVVLSAGSVNPEVLDPQLPKFAHWLFVSGALNYLNDDLKHAEAYYQLHKAWLPFVFAHPANIVKDVARGFELSTTKYSMALSYADLGVAMVRMADEGEWVGKAVTIKSNDEKAIKQELADLVPLIKGLYAHYFTKFWTLGRKMGAL
ncbi:MAG: hypothetical protein M1825_005380 [Sarcosagium campestre]|nr:MAG: hypothetical protein M1825_005380 [Sarcosagium campestre]